MTKQVWHVWEAFLVYEDSYCLLVKIRFEWIGMEQEMQFWAGALVCVASALSMTVEVC